MHRCLLLSLLLLIGCSRSADAPPAPPPATPAPVVKTQPTAYTTSFVADWLVRRLGGDDVASICVQPPGSDPTRWQPDGAVVASLADAPLIVSAGLGFEVWMATATLPESRIVGALDSVKPIRVESATHSHGKAGAHSHGELDPHAWNDPDALSKAAVSVAEALSKVFPHESGKIEANLARLRADLGALDGEFKAALAAARPLRLASSHPSWRYLARRYRITIESFTFDPTTPPSAEQLAAFVAWSADGAPDALLWESEPTEAVRAAFPAGIAHVVLDPLESPLGDAPYDYLAQARTNVAAWKALTAK